MLTSIDVKFIFDSAFLVGKFRRWTVVHFCKYSPNSMMSSVEWSSCYLCCVLNLTFAYFFLAKRVKSSAI